MKRSNRLVILVGVLLAVLAFVGIVFLLNNGGGPNGPEGSQTPLVTVLVADNDIAIGEEVTPNKVKTKQVDPSAVVGTPLTDPSQLSGRPAVQAVARGGQVSLETVGGGGANVCISCSLLPGEKAVAFQVDRVTGLDFLIQPGDHIDIVMRQDIQVVQPATQTGPQNQWKYEVVTTLDGTPIVKTVLQNKRVLYVSQTRVPTAAAQPTPTPAEGAAPPPEITSVVIIIAVSSDSEADLIKMAQSNVGTIGNLTAILRAQGDDVTDSSSTGLTVSELIRIYGVPIPDVVILERSVTP